MRAWAWLAAAALATGVAAETGVSTTISLLDQREDVPKVALPAVEVRVDGPDVERARLVADAIAADLAALVHSRPAGGGETATYVVAVDLKAGGERAIAAQQEFEARLIAFDGTPVWRAAGATRGDAAPIEGEALKNLAHNVVSALVRDGWLQPKYDPDDPPPPPPSLRRDER